MNPSPNFIDRRHSISDLENHCATITEKSFDFIAACVGLHSEKAPLVLERLQKTQPEAARISALLAKVTTHGPVRELDTVLVALSELERESWTQHRLAESKGEELAAAWLELHDAALFAHAEGDNLAKALAS